LHGDLYFEGTGAAANCNSYQNNIKDINWLLTITSHQEPGCTKLLNKIAGDAVCDATKAHYSSTAWLINNTAL